MFGRQRIDTYTQMFQVVPGAFADRQNVNEGGQILLPQSVLHDISSMNLVYPLQFILRSHKGKSTHCGVLEFVADEGQAVLPQWMMEQLKLDPWDMVTLQTVVLPKAEFIRLRPRQSAFIELHDPRAVLETRLTKYSALSKGDTISIHYCDTEYKLDITVVRAKSLGEVAAASIIDTEVQVDFERPADMPDSPVRTAAPPMPTAAGKNVIGGTAVAGGTPAINFEPVKTYKPPSLTDEPPAKAAGSASASPSFVPFGGSGRSISGANRPSPQGSPAASPAAPGSAALPPAGGRSLGGGGRALSGNPSPVTPAASPASAASPAVAGMPLGGRTLSGKTPPPQPQPGAAVAQSASQQPSAPSGGEFKPFVGAGRTLK